MHVLDQKFYFLKRFWYFKSEFVCSFEKERGSGHN